jgi:hypothetical protein
VTGANCGPAAAIAAQSATPNAAPRKYAGDVGCNNKRPAKGRFRTSDFDVFMNIFVTTTPPNRKRQSRRPR